MGIANSNIAFRYRLTPDIASQIQATGPAARYSPAAHLPRTSRLHLGRPPRVAEHN